MKNVLFTLLIIPMLFFGQNSKKSQEVILLEELNELLFTEYVLHKNIKPFNETATDDFILIAAPGNIETKQQAIDGVENLNISSVNVIVNKTIKIENIAIVVGILELKGTIMNRPVPGTIRYSSTFMKEDDTWRLIARTMTPMRMK